MLRGAPEELDEAVVDRTILTVHADADVFDHAVFAEQGRVCHVGELESLIAVEDLRFAVNGDGLLDHAHDPFGLQAVGYAPVGSVAEIRIDHGHQVDEATVCGHVGEDYGPHLVAIGLWLHDPG